MLPSYPICTNNQCPLFAAITARSYPFNDEELEDIYMDYYSEPEPIERWQCVYINDNNTLELGEWNERDHDRRLAPIDRISDDLNKSDCVSKDIIYTEDGMYIFKCTIGKYARWY